MVNASSCTVESWIHLGDVLGRLLSSQELEFTKCCRKIWWCVNQPFIPFIHLSVGTVQSEQRVSVWYPEGNNALSAKT